jgi:hypothetical protein
MSLLAGFASSRQQYRKSGRHTHYRRRGAQEHQHLRDGSVDEDRFLELDAAMCNEGRNVFD